MFLISYLKKIHFNDFILNLLLKTKQKQILDMFLD